LRDSILAGQCVLFLGAGATREANGPTGLDLAALLADHFQKPDIPRTDLKAFADLLTSLPDVHREDLDAKIVSVLRHLQPSAAHRTLPKFCWKAIFTTNYDRLVEQSYDTAFAITQEHALQDLRPIVTAKTSLPLTDPTSIGLFKLHGCIGEIGPGTPLVLTTEDYARSKKNRQHMLRYLKALAAVHSIFFVGYGFGDGIIMSLLDELEQESPYNSRRRMYVLDPHLSRSGAEAFAARNLVHVPATMATFFSQLDAHTATEARKQVLAARLRPITDPSGAVLSLPTRLRITLESQVEILDPTTHPVRDARRFLSGLPPTAGDLRNENDFERVQLVALSDLLGQHLDSEEYVRPLVVVLGPGGSGKTTLAMRAAYNLAVSQRAVAIKLRSHDLWRRNELVDFAVRVNGPSIFVMDGIELVAAYKAMRELRNELSGARARALLLTSCQKAAWNALAATYQQKDAILFDLEDVLSLNEAGALIDRLVSHEMLPKPSPKERQRQTQHIMEDCEGHLVVAMLDLVRDGTFRDIVLGEFENISTRGKLAYQYVALFHQHGLSVPDYILNAVTVDDWRVFEDEVIRQESDLIIVQDLNYAARRIAFRTRHPKIAELIVEVTIPQHEDRIRMYRRVFKAVGTSEEDRQFLLSVLTSRTVRDELREDKYIVELFDAAMDLFPEDRTFILHLGKFETYAGRLDRARELLEWGRSLDPSDTYILHQLGVCYERMADREAREANRTGKYQDALRCYREKQSLDPTSHYGYVSEAKMHLKRARREEDAEPRLVLLAEADDAIRRGLSLVRDDSLDAVREVKASLADSLGDRAEVVRSITELKDRGALRYAGTYQLLASSLVQLDRIEDGVRILEEGLEVYPGDVGLMGLLLDVLESRMHRSEVRTRCTSLLSDPRLRDGRPTQAMFVQNVIDYYESRFEQCREGFKRLRERNRRPLPTKVRVFACDENGVRSRMRALVSRGPAALLMAKDVETGMRMRVMNSRRWQRLGEPATATCEVGFSLDGPRCVVLEKWEPA
jgi:tetratricopeptide (TPR) repeat protein